MHELMCGTAVPLRGSLAIPWTFFRTRSRQASVLPANAAGQNLNVHGNFNSSNKIPENRKRPDAANKDGKPQQKRCRRFLFISDQWIKTPEKDGRQMALSKKYLSSREIDAFIDGIYPLLCSIITLIERFSIIHASKSLIHYHNEQSTPHARTSCGYSGAGTLDG